MCLLLNDSAYVISDPDDDIAAKKLPSVPHTWRTISIFILRALAASWRASWCLIKHLLTHV